jgi:hypothetical protein
MADSRPCEQLLSSGKPDPGGIITGAGDHIQLPMAVQDPGLGTCEQAPAPDDDQIAMRYVLTICDDNIGFTVS